MCIIILMLLVVPIPTLILILIPATTKSDTNSNTNSKTVLKLDTYTNAKISFNAIINAILILLIMVEQLFSVLVLVLVQKNYY